MPSQHKVLIDKRKFLMGRNVHFLNSYGINPFSQHNNAIRDFQVLSNHPKHLANILELNIKEEKQKDRLRLKMAIAVVN